MGPKRQIGELVNNELFYFGLLLKRNPGQKPIRCHGYVALQRLIRSKQNFLQQTNLISQSGFLAKTLRKSE